MAFFPTVLSGQAGEQFPHQDFETRINLDATHSLSKSTDFLFGTEVYFSRDQGHMAYRKISTGFSFCWGKFLTFEPYYQYSLRDSASGPLRHENRLAFATTVGTPWKHWVISDRNLGERRFEEDGQSWRYRNRIEFSRPLNLERKQVSVFVWDEVYYSSTARRWYRNRVALGASRRLTRKIAIEVYYLHQNDGYSRPGDLDGVEMTLRTRF